MTSSGQIVEGVFAINKPPAISSAQVIRDVQEHFNPSSLFKPWLDREQAKRDAEHHNQRQKRKARGRRANAVKMGHGGTLDPMATGVLILGVGSGTKQLNHFMTDCVKSYEATVVFGAATDSYDTEGKIVGRKPYEHVTRDMVEEALSKFRGKGSQKPPVFSALRMQGKRLYEYAREGKELPEEIKERPVEVHELEMVEWYPGGTHEWSWPDREAQAEEKKFADKVLSLSENAKFEIDNTLSNTKRKRDDLGGQDGSNGADETKRRKPDNSPAIELKTDTNVSSAERPTDPTSEASETAQTADQAASHDVPPEAQPTFARQRCPAPACRIRMTVTSGFYVRSLCHDLGAAVGSLAIMSSLVRTKQGEFELGTNVLWYDELKQGEDVWGPKVKQLLQESGDGAKKRIEEKLSEKKLPEQELPEQELPEQELPEEKQLETEKSIE